MKKQKNNKQKKSPANNNYDWFQGKAGTKGALTPKQKVHKVWKIIRTFLYITLAGLSLTGCIQSFVVKTPSGVGQGMELYSKKENVAPHITTLRLNSDGTLTVDLKKQYWINRNESDKVMSSAKNSTLDLIQKQIGEGYWHWKTENNGIRVENENGLAINNFGGVAKKENTVLKIGTQKSATTGKTTGGKYAVVGQYGKDTFIAPSSITIPFYYPTGVDIKKQPNAKPWGRLDVTLNIKDIYGENVEAQKLNAIVLNEYLSYASTIKDGLFKNAEKAFKELNKPNNATDFISLLAMTKYNLNIQSISAIFGIDAWNTTKITNGISAGVANPSANIINGKSIHNFFTFHLSNGNKQRAIYNWSKAWTLGPFYGMFVYPLSKLTLGIQEGLPSSSVWYGWETILTLLFAVFIIRTFAYALTFKATLQQVKQQELSGKKASIEAKYAQYKGNKQMEQRKRQEMSDMFKKEGISPLGSIGSIFLTMPIFLAMWKIIGGLAHFKSTDWLGINFSQTSWRELIYNKGWQYLPLMFTAAIVQGFSVVLPRILTKRRDKTRMNAQQKTAMKKANKTQNIMAIVFVVMAVIMSAGIQVYWIFGGIFTTLQNVLNHYIIKRQSKKRKEKKIRA